MFKELSSTLVDKAIVRNVVKEDNREEYIYGFNVFLTTAINILSALIIGILMHMLLEIILFIITYKVLRKNIGGNHSKNARRCYISSCVTYIVALSAIKFYSLTAAFTTLLVIICLGVIFAIAPVEAEKKPLDEIEKIVYGRRSKIDISICTAIYIILCYMHLNRFSIIVAIAIFVVTIFAVEGKVKHYLCKRAVS